MQPQSRSPMPSKSDSSATSKPENTICFSGLKQQFKMIK